MKFKSENNPPPKKKQTKNPKNREINNYRNNKTYEEVITIF